MPLSYKLALATTLSIAAVLGGLTLRRLEREKALFETEMRHDHATFGSMLALSADFLAKQSGAGEAIAMLGAADGWQPEVRIAWEPGPPPAVPASAAADVTTDVTAGALSSTVAPVSAIHRDRRGDETLVTRVPVVLEGGAPGAIVLREAMSRRERYLRETRLRALFNTLFVVLVCGVIILVVGFVFVRRPLLPLLAKLRRIGAGDWSGPLGLEQTDEIGTIAREVDAMCERLSESHARAEREAEARIAALDQLQHAERLATVGKLASGIAHELGTPLNVVSASARMIVRGESAGSDAVEDAGVIVEQTERMTLIIRQLLDFARRRHPRKVEQSLAGLVEHTLHMLEALGTKAGVRLVRAPSEALRAHVDAGQLQQVLTNLVMNAIQAQPRGGEVRLGVARSEAPSPGESGPLGAHACIWVEDDGPGIAPDALERVFEPFFTTKEVGQGTGLGLSVAYGIIREHGGFLTVSSELDRGSRFEVHLPMEPS